MSQFPKTEAEIAALGLLVIEGLEKAPDDFPNPPVPVAELRAKLEAFNGANAAAVAADTAAQEQHAVKDDALAALAHSLRINLKYAEFAARDEPERLKRLGWSPRREGTPLQPPGEVRDISIGGEGDTWVILRWKPPVDGGVPGVYKIQRRRDGSPWEDIGIATTTEHLASGQPRGVELYYRVFAVNKAGTGQPSATVTVVL
ncbi:MAG TPA: fibronectin type III domain-containing protein [Gemmatimonadales bacterium]|nr:fibronectin type III domain-containing protein [Gemmatimonadales bacterium]